MSKTQFSNGTIVTPEFLNSMFHTNGGHRHDGGDGDGSAPRIRLDSHTLGVLPPEQLGHHRHSGTHLPNGDPIPGGQPKIDLVTDVEGMLPAANIGGHNHFELVREMESGNYWPKGTLGTVHRIIGNNGNLVVINIPYLQMPHIYHNGAGIRSYYAGAFDAGQLGIIPRYEEMIFPTLCFAPPVYGNIGVMAITRQTSTTRIYRLTFFLHEPNSISEGTFIDIAPTTIQYVSDPNAQ